MIPCGRDDESQWPRSIELDYNDALVYIDAVFPGWTSKTRPYLPRPLYSEDMSPSSVPLRATDGNFHIRSDPCGELAELGGRLVAHVF